MCCGSENNRLRFKHVEVTNNLNRDVTHQLEYPEVGVTELTLSNGMQVCYKSTDFLDDQVLFTGFAYGGLSELPESDYISCSMGSTIAGEIGMFGYKPSMLMDMLAGKRVEVSARLRPYMRTFSCDRSPTDLKYIIYENNNNK
ncbi:hypothetical protein HID58_047161 [Brassica napus]|uniref:Uncharacterized protein n=1 Tax=Brassica napus TaxID=3708 RepID=A0ABQ8AZH0_BRANA|nr:hypothetical protein HID58_047161 [Brassica napus]